MNDSPAPKNGGTLAANVINWFEIPCIQLDRAQAFYEKMLGRSMRREDFGGSPIVLFIYEGPATGGCLVAMAERTPVADAGVRVYLDCEPGVQAALDRVAAAGGTIVDPCMALPDGMGFIAHIRDTEGNTIGLHAMAR